MGINEKSARILSPEILALSWIAIMLPASAAEWSIEPSVTAATNYSDNFRLLDESRLVQPIQSNIEFSVSPALQFGHETEVRNVKGKLRIAANRFNNDKALNSNDAFFDINWVEKGERSEFRLLSNNSFDSTLATLLQDVGNATEDRRQRLRVSVNPTYAYNLDARLALALGYRYEDVGFRDARNTVLVDYRSNELLPSLRYKFDERNELEVNTRLWQLITVPDNLSISRSTFKSGFLSATYNQTIDESSSWSAGVGYYSIDENTTGNTNSTLERKTTYSGPTAIAKYMWRNEYGNASVTAAREINPSGENTLLRTTRVGADLSRGISTYVTAGISSSAFKNDVIGGAIEKSSKYFRVSPSLSWKPARNWNIDGGVVYQRTQTTSNVAANTKADAKSVYLNFIYVWDKTAVSR
ncbi:MAG: hypothetical protein WCB36_05810 [Burkholderiales bacterium]